MAFARSDTAGLEVLRDRSRLLRLVVVGIFAVIVGQLGWLQLIQGSVYRGLSENNYVQHTVVEGPRGLIRDRNGGIIADNRAAFSISATRMRGRDDERVASLLARLLGVDRDLVSEKLREARSRYYGSVPIVEDADFGQVSRVEERRAQLPGIKVETTAVRRYEYEEAPIAPHAVGHVGRISDDALRIMTPLGYTQRDVVGKSGVEERFEIYLQGRDGSEYWVCDASGRELYPFRGWPWREPRPGNTLVLTIDAPAQRAAELALSEFEGGAVVAIEPSTGDILVSASHPAPDPNEMAIGLTVDRWRQLSTSPEHPLMNRAIQGTYPPGSPFKLVTAAVGLATGQARYEDRVFCRGAYKYGIRTFRCWRAEGHGSVDLLDGIIESCDVYFYQLGARLGVERLMEWTLRAGLGRKTGIDIAGERTGNVPTPSWYDRHYGRRRWSKGVVINLAIGQGELLVTPLQAACLTCGIVNGGPVYVPHLVGRIETHSSRLIGEATRRLSYRLPFDDLTLAFLRRAMVGVVEAPNGTGKQARIPGMRVGGKTGTAQNPHGEDHSWFVSFAPADDPQIVVAVLVEHGGSGGAVAAPIAREIMKAYLRVESPRPVERSPDEASAPEPVADGGD